MSSLTTIVTIIVIIIITINYDNIIKYSTSSSINSITSAISNNTSSNSINEIDYNVKQNNVMMLKEISNSNTTTSTISTTTISNNTSNNTNSNILIELHTLQNVHNINDSIIEADDDEYNNNHNKKTKGHHPNVRKVEYLKYNNNTSIDDSKYDYDKSIKIFMVQYPGLKKYNGFLPHGKWLSGIYPKDMIGRNIDFIQDRARKDGYYVVYNNNNKPIDIHIFSTYEAAECLRNKRIIIVGDSYMKQMYIGAVDIMLQNPSNTIIEGGRFREIISRQAAKFLSKSKAIKSRNIHLSYDDKCIHSSLNCLMNNIMRNKYYRQADYLISNILVHDLENNKNHTSRLTDYLGNLEKLFAFPNSKLLWVTGPSYDLNRVPDKYLEVTKNRPTVFANKEAFVLADRYKIPILDFYSLTGTCRWKNCSTDGGHRSRFVNRMKFQLVLNNICKRNKK